jgi:eukaryotic-like serine/threonine-protein kinase
MIDRLNAALEGRYRVERELGEGGMATVYLAEDVKHRRNVALKVLRPELAAVVGAERFLAEIETTASLQHPHILPLFDSGEADSFLFYVMPYVEGESLREKLDREKQLPVDEAVAIAVKVLSALQHAHEQGIVHRDVKPANILLAGDEPLVADFGIALAVSQAGGGRITETGLSLGTPHYMSPEQAVGERELDLRSDLWAVGCVLYEMLAGEPPFVAPSSQAVLARILTEEAPSVSTSRRTVPSNVAYAIRRSLQRLPADRFRSAREFVAALRDPHVPAAAGGVPTARAQPARRGLLLAGWLLSLGLLAWIAIGPRSQRAASPPPVYVFDIQPADSAVLPFSVFPALSPDGELIVFSAWREGRSRLQMRRLDRPRSEWIPGTEGARRPFFTPDGRAVLFFTDEGLKEVELATGAARTLSTDERLGRFDQWGVALDDGWVLFSHNESRDVWGLPPRSRDPVVLLHHDSVPGAVAVDVGPGRALPGNRALVLIHGEESFRTGILTPSTGRLVELDGEGAPGFFWGDTLVLWQPGERTRLARVDWESGKVTAVGDLDEPWGAGTRVRVLTRDLALAVWTGGTLGESAGRLTWRSPTGEVEEVGPSGEIFWEYPRISPEGGRIVIASFAPREAHVVMDLATGITTPLAARGGEHEWSADGGYVFFNHGEPRRIVRQRADGAAPPETLVEDLDTPAWITSAAPDGSILLYFSNGIRALDLETLEVRLLIDDAGIERNGEFSPDGRWIAYTSNGSGRDEIYVKPYPALDRRYTVSPDGGDQPIWARHGSELYYISGDRLMAAAVHTADGSFRSERPRLLFRGGFYVNPDGDQSYDVAEDGRFLMIAGGGDTRIRVMTGWLQRARGEEP